MNHDTDQRELTALSGALRRSALILLSLCAALPVATATHANEDRWYQIEVILFGQPESESDEKWRQDITLRYPEHWKTLKDPEKAIQQLEELSQKNAVESNQWVPFADILPDEPSSEPVIEVPLTGEMPYSADPDPAAAEEQPDFSVDQFEVDLEPDSTEEPDAYPRLTASGLIDLATLPYYLLPESERQLNQQARSIRLSANYRLLSHFAWRQPFKEGQTAPAILIATGEQFGDHHELEGSLSIVLSRYLHVHTNLWLTRFKHNFGNSLDTGWPSLPLSPQIKEDRWSLLPDHQNWSLSDWQFDESINTILNTPYLPEQIITINNHRRMKSGEIHYLDHPKVGMIILCTPYELPELSDEEEDIE